MGGLCTSQQGASSLWALKPGSQRAYIVTIGLFLSGLTLSGLTTLGRVDAAALRIEHESVLVVTSGSSQRK